MIQLTTKAANSLVASLLMATKSLSVIPSGSAFPCAFMLVMASFRSVRHRRRWQTCRNADTAGLSKSPVMAQELRKNSSLSPSRRIPSDLTQPYSGSLIRASTSRCRQGRAGSEDTQLRQIKAIQRTGHTFAHGPAEIKKVPQMRTVLRLRENEGMRLDSVTAYVFDKAI